MSKTKSKKFGKFWAKMLIGLITVLRNSLGQYIANENLRNLYFLTLKPSENIINALSDENPDNKEQINEIFQKHLNTAVIPYGQEQFKALSDKIKDPGLMQLVATAGTIPFAVGQIYTDENPENEQQLKAFLEVWVENPENQKNILAAITVWVSSLFKENPALANFIISALEARILAGEFINVDFDGDGV